MVHLLMATYQGEPYLQAQIESLRRQTYRDWRLLVRDDGSTDGTVDLLREAARRDNRIHRIDDDLGRLGVRGSFSVLMRHGLKENCRYVRFVDQDDVWVPDGIRRLWLTMRSAERRFGPHCPLLVHSDLEVVGPNLEPIADSFLAFQGLRHEPVDPLKTLLVQNFVTGCAMMMNSALLKHATPAPEQANFHDWWVAAVAAATGRILFVPEPLVRYRQHGRNAVGATGYWQSLVPWRKRWRVVSPEANARFHEVLEQAKALAERLRELDEPAASRVEAFVKTFAPDASRWARPVRLTLQRVGRQDLPRHLLLLLRTLTVM